MQNCFTETQMHAESAKMTQACFKAVNSLQSFLKKCA